MSAMKESRKSALKSLIKSMNMKRHTKKDEAVDPEEETETADEDLHDGDPESPMEDAATERAEDDDKEDPSLEDKVKGFMKRGHDRSPHKSGASLTVIMNAMGKKRK